MDKAKQLALEFFQLLKGSEEIILNQIGQQIGGTAFFSWGVEKIAPSYSMEKFQFGIKMKVNGRLFSGWVHVRLQKGRTCAIYKQTELGAELEALCEDAELKNFAEIIDRDIETGSDPEEYRNFCEGEREKMNEMLGFDPRNFPNLQEIVFFA